MKPRWMTSTGRLVTVAVARLVRYSSFFRVGVRASKSADPLVGLLSIKLGVRIIFKLYVALLDPFVKGVCRVVGHDLGANPCHRILSILETLIKLPLYLRYNLEMFLLELCYRFRLLKIFWGFDERYNDCGRLRDGCSEYTDYGGVRYLKRAQQNANSRNRGKRIATQQRVNDMLLEGGHVLNSSTNVKHTHRRGEGALDRRNDGELLLGLLWHNRPVCWVLRLVLLDFFLVDERFQLPA
jgi:hypothetical protein